jgi:FkbM family methyltransferase
MYMEPIIFTNDDSVHISPINHSFSDSLRRRNHHEVLFRRINTFLIKNNYIKNNIIDLGAWIGDNSMPWAKNITGTVYAIDPSPGNCDFIKKTCELNKITNVKVIQTAVSNINEPLSTNENIDHCSFVYRNPGLTGVNKVNAVSLDYLYQINMIENIGYIHLDVEGMEYKVIEGSRKIIEECRPIISFEQHLEIDEYDKLASHLKGKNYRIFLIDEVLAGCRPDCRNSFAFPNEIYNDMLLTNIHKYIGKDILIPK